MKRVLCIWLPDWPIQRIAALGEGGGRGESEERRGKREERRGEAAGDLAALAAVPAAAKHPSPSHPVTPSSRHPLTPSSLPRDPWADREALEALAEWCQRFSPIVGLEDSAAPESLLLDITGLAHLFDGEASLAEEIIHDFARRRLTARVAVADTLGAAWAVAHFNPSFIHHSSFIIHHSSLIILPPGETLPALCPLPVAALRLPKETVGLLRQLGIDRIGQLEALPRGELSSRFGPELLSRWDQAIGRLAEPVPAHVQPAKLEAVWAAEHPTARRESIEAVLEQLIGQVARTLARLGRGAMRLECRLDCGSGGSMEEDAVEGNAVRISVGLFRPTASPGHLFSLAQMQFERLGLPGPLWGMHVAVAATAPLLEDQQELFFHGDGSSRRRAHYLADLIDRLSSRLGRRSVLRARLVSDAQPELAWRYDPIVDGSRRRTSRKPRATAVSAVPDEPSAEKARPTRPWHRRMTPAELPPRPLRLLRRPVALAVTSVLPDGPPAHFQFGGRSHRIANSWGPERIETGWWRKRTVGRDYYHIETTSGRRFWLFRRLRDGRWFMQGTFE